MSDELKIEKQGRVALCMLNRPDKLNALSPDLRDGLAEALEGFGDDDEVGVVVITGAGKGFCSGADVSGPWVGERPSINERLDEYDWVGRQAMAVHELDKPVLCAVNGVAAGAGFSLAAACDMRLGSEHTRFRNVFIERNLVPEAGLTFFLPRIVGASRAADLVYTSRTVEAEEALRIGLIDRLVRADELLPAAMELAERMLQWPPLALRMSKRALKHGEEADLRTALRYERKMLNYTGLAKSDMKEARDAFIEKRKPKYTGT